MGMSSMQKSSIKGVFGNCLKAAIWVILIAATAEADWLEGGYVGSGGSSDMAAYFTDPIFTSPAGSYQSSDPAISEMQSSLDRPLALGYTSSRTSSQRTLTAPPAISTPAATANANASGRWSLTLSEGRTIELQLYQSGSRVFGAGSIIQGVTQGSAQNSAHDNARSRTAATYTALASGTISGDALQLDVVIQSGTELYSMTIDLSRLHLSPEYLIYRVGAQPASGTVKAIRMP